MTARMTFRGGMGALAFAATAAAPMTAAGQGWDYRASLYVWMSGIDTSVATPFGTVEAELSFSDLLEDLNFAAFGTFEAENGPWLLLGDFNYSDLSARRDSPFGAVFSDVEVDTTLTIASAFGGYAIVDRPDLRIEAGGGLRFYDVSVDTRLVGNPGVPNVDIPRGGSWVDVILGLHLRAPIGERWYARGFADVGGFGIGDSSELSWQIYAGGGYAINETWAIEAGYRHLSIDKDLDNSDVTLEQSGPLIGVTARF
jgi:opacity protein-like surface antigen